MKPVIKLTLSELIENKLKELKQKLRTAKKLGKLRTVKRIKAEIESLNKKLDEL